MKRLYRTHIFPETSFIRMGFFIVLLKLLINRLSLADKIKEDGLSTEDVAS